MKKVIAVDFDGTCTIKNEFPRIGLPNNKVLDKLKELKKQGHYIVLWTCRSGRRLKEAEIWLKNRGVELDGSNVDVRKISDSAKIYATVYLDDRALHVDDIDEIDKRLK